MQGNVQHTEPTMNLAFTSNLRWALFHLWTMKYRVDRISNFSCKISFKMFFQASFPILFTIVPIGLYYLISYTTLDAVEYGSIVMILFNSQTAVNPFITIYFISPSHDRVLHAAPCHRNYGKLLVKSTNVKQNENSTSNVIRASEFAKTNHWEILLISNFVTDDASEFL